LPFGETYGPLQKILASQTNERKAEILKAVTEAAKMYFDSNVGKVRVENEAILIVGKKCMSIRKNYSWRYQVMTY
jgi:hypothetical protein